MTLREELHQLVDTLPEGALENAKDVLEHLQVWPPQPPPELERMRQIQQEQMERMRRSMQPGTSGGGGGGGIIHAGGYGHSGHSRIEGDTGVNETHHFYKGSELAVTERFRAADNGKALHYERAGRIDIQLVLVHHHHEPRRHARLPTPTAG